MIERLLLLGATGDLAGRFVLPALAALRAAGKLAAGFEVLGAARDDLDEAAFRHAVSERLEQHAAAVPRAAREQLVSSLRYRSVDLDQRDSVASLIDAGSGPVAAYLALPPKVFPDAVTTLGAVDLPWGSRIAVENPFGEDLESAVRLNRLLARAAGSAGERASFRVDHVLGMATVQNLIGMRLANPMLDAFWSSVYIDRVDILWEEKLAVDGRAGYYDHTGALRDVLQNHMLQILCLIAMEPSATSGEHDLRDRKLDVLRSVRQLPREEMTSRTCRARYTAGRFADQSEEPGQEVPDYIAEEGVDPDRGTETFAEVILELDTPRWAGTRFVLRAGKALGRRRKMAVLRFRPGAYPPFVDPAAPAHNELRIGLDGPEDISLELTGREAGPPSRPTQLRLAGAPLESGLPAYGRVLWDILEGGSDLSVRGDEAEQAWRVVAPVLEAWSSGRVPLREYQAGSSGPPPLLPSRNQTSRCARGRGDEAFRLRLQRSEGGSRRSRD